MKYAVISTSISPHGNFINTTLHGTFDSRDHAVGEFNAQCERELPNYRNAKDVGARTIFSGDKTQSKLIVEILVSTHIDDKQ